MRSFCEILSTVEYMLFRLDYYIWLFYHDQLTAKLGNLQWHAVEW